MPFVRNDGRSLETHRNLPFMLRLPRTLAFVFVAAGVAIACSSSDKAAGGSSGTNGNGSSGSAKNTDGGDNTGTVQVPCGGAGQKACGGAQCKQASDCASGDCDPTGACTTPAPVPPSATDGKKDGTETDVDCGGDAAPKCDDTKTCSAATDCTSGVCNTTCQTPTATDKVQNGDETDVDCGGTTTAAPACDTGLKCKVHADCKSDGCDDTGKCALERSCTQTNGGTTCGTGEVGDQGAQHESCCVSLPIPGSTTRLDKYKITAGRMRAFVERTKGDVQGWYNGARATLSPAQQAQIDPILKTLPTSLKDGGDGDGTGLGGGEPAGAEYQLGATIFYTDRPSNEQGCYTGSGPNDQANGSHTYWTGTDEGEDRGFDQKFLDTLTLNCVTEPMAAAFCVWDGGRLQTFAENSAAYGAGPYPWGASPTVGGFTGDDFHSFGPATNPTGPCTEVPDQSCVHDWMNWSSDYQFPDGGNANKPWDYAYFISPPGRFAHDKGPGGHMDIGGLMMELTTTPGANDPSYGATVKWSRAGSWEGHEVNYGQYAFAIMTKYGKTGARCARD